MKIVKWLAIAALLATSGVHLLAQDSLSTQVLQLLNRLNTWTVLQTFAAGIKLTDAVPSDTTDTLYNCGGDLCWDGGSVTGGGSSLTPHNLLSSTHSDTLAAAAVRGSWIVGNSTPKWSAHAVCASGEFIRSDGTDMLCSAVGSSLTSLNAANLTGTLAALSGVNLTALNATQLTSGTVPLARLSGITTSQLSASAAIVRSQLSIAAGIVLTTDVTGLLPPANGGLGIATVTDDTIVVANGSLWQSKGIPDCDASTSALNYDTTSNAFTCRTISVGTGTVTSAALSLPAIFSVSGSPVTTTGTLTAALATQLANRVWAGPTTGAAAPTFRALVTADLPATGVSAGTTSGFTYSAGGTILGVAALVAGDLPVVTVAKGGTGSATLGDDNIMVGATSTTAAVTALPNCLLTTCWGLGYATATNSFSAITARTVIAPVWLGAGFCQNATVVLNWSTPTSNPGVGACVTGSNTQKLVVDFADGGSSLSIQRELKLPSDWTSTVDVVLTWYTTATSGDVVWQVATTCVAVAETGDPSFNTASTVTDTAAGTTNQYNTATITGLTTTGCAAGEVLYLKVLRDPTTGADTLAATARLVGVELVLRRSI